jgi:quercetin dioxygenase-like cupin family protein
MEKAMSIRATTAKLAMATLTMVGLAHSASAPTTQAVTLTTRPLIGIPGKEGMMLTVEFQPGASSPPHRHNANTFVYVLEGSVVMGVAGGEEVTLRPGQTFYESPTDVHTVARNASQTEPAQVLVFFVKDTGAPAALPAK